MSDSPGYEEYTEKNKQTGQTSMEHFEFVKSQQQHLNLSNLVSNSIWQKWLQNNR